MYAAHVTSELGTHTIFYKTLSSGTRNATRDVENSSTRTLRNPVLTYPGDGSGTQRSRCDHDCTSTHLDHHEAEAADPGGTRDPPPVATVAPPQDRKSSVWCADASGPGLDGTSGSGVGRTGGGGGRPLPPPPPRTRTTSLRPKRPSRRCLSIASQTFLLHKVSGKGNPADFLDLLSPRYFHDETTQKNPWFSDNKFLQQIFPRKKIL